MNKTIIGTSIIAAGLALCGLFVELGIHRLANKDRAVTVKGLSMQDVKADHVVWPLNFVINGNNLPALYKDLAGVQKTVTDFLVEKGFAATDIQMGTTGVNDNWANYYDRRPDNHYTLNSSVIISTDNVDLVIASQGVLTELLNEGIILNSYDWAVDYQYNSLNDLKPQMIEEATKNARAVAQMFADDAQCRLGSIRRANQGQFSVESDQYQPWIKHVRVVTTVDYYLN